ncbi:hypothetical protein PENTCL1PPCAC_15559, partial [Pristionchus entomophagus]
ISYSSEMIFDHPFFKQQYVCFGLSPPNASKIWAGIAAALGCALALDNWFWGHYLSFNLYITFIFALQLGACFLVFLACSRLQAVLMLPIILFQAFNCLSVCGTAIWFIIDAVLAHYYFSTIIYNILMYILSLLLSMYILQVHGCCFNYLKEAERGLTQRSAQNNVV